MEQGTATDQPPGEVEQPPRATDQPPVPYGAARLPHGNATQIEVEKALAQMKPEKGKTSILKELFWGKDVFLFEAEGPGSRVEIPFTVEQDGDYELSTQIAQASNFGVYEVLLDGKPVAVRELEHEPGADIRQGTQFDAYAYDTYVGLDRQLGWMRLTKGPHSVTFVCLGKNAAATGYNLGVDNLILARTGPDGWGRAAAIREPKLTAQDVPGLSRELSSAPDPRVRTMAAIALSEKGAAASSALPALIAAVKDPDPFVREAAVRAIGAQGAAAASAVPALVAACEVPGQPGYVVRSALYSLGMMGKAAAPALPAVKKMTDPNWSWVVEKTVRDIEGTTPR
jgi:hypothetical protein